MPRCFLACALIALLFALAPLGCGSNQDAPSNVNADANGSEGKTESAEDNSGSDKQADKSRKDNDEEAKSDETSIAREPTAASLEGLSFELRPFIERDGGKVRVEGHRKHYSNSIVVLHGKYTQYYSDGAKQAEGQYKDDAKSGKWLFWHPNGQKSKEGSYLEGFADGKWTHWRPDGSPQSEGQFRRGRRVGVWTLIDSSGNKRTRDYSPKPQ